MLNRLFRWWGQDVAIDLGTANTLIFLKGHGLLLNEPSIVTIRTDRDGSKQLDAVGLEAKAMLGRTPGNIQSLKPVRDGVVANLSVTEAMLAHFLAKALPKGRLGLGSRVLLCVPCGATQVERRAIRDAALGAGAGEVWLIDEPLAAALGAELPIAEARGSMVLDIGGGTSEVALLSMGGAVYSATLKVGGDRFDEAIIAYVRRKHGVLIGEATAEHLKHKIGSAYPGRDPVNLVVSGRNLTEGVPQQLTLTSHEMLEALQEALNEIVASVKAAMEQCPPELSSDIGDRGIVLTGGGALLKGIKQLLQEETGVPVTCADDPMTAVIRGAGRVLEILDTRQGRELVSDKF